MRFAERMGRLGTETAFEVLARAVELGYDDPAHLRRDPDLDSIRDDGRFSALLARLEEEA